MDGETDFEAGFTRPGFEFDFATVTVPNDAVADDQAQAGAGADRFGGEEWLEHARLDLRGNAGTVVHDFDQQLVGIEAGADTDFAGAIYGGDSVINEISPNLIEFAAISGNPRDGTIECPNEGHIFQFVTEHGQGALDSFVDVHLLHRRLIHIRVGFDGFDEFSNSRGALVHLADQRFQIQTRLEPGERISVARGRKLGGHFGEPG